MDEDFTLYYAKFSERLRTVKKGAKTEDGSDERHTTILSRERGSKAFKKKEEEKGAKRKQHDSLIGVTSPHRNILKSRRDF